MSSLNIVHVAVGVIQNQHGQLLLAKRPKDSHQGDLWEFPGGKVENNESVLEALKRELFEEIGITFTQACPLIRIHHNYDDKSVLLDVWSIDEFTGEAFGKEGQTINWIKKNELSLYDFPAANLPIIKALQLPDKYMITGHLLNENDLITRIQDAIKTGIRLIQFRAPDLTDKVYFDYAEKIFFQCKKENVKLLLNTSFESYKHYQAFKFSHGLHLNSKEIQTFSSDDTLDGLLISTSTHNHEELLVAEEKKVDFIVLSPVNKTLSHPESTPLGWEKFKDLTDKCCVPVYALGGMNKNNLKEAKNNGAQGIAAIGAFWNI